jgi:hypothetical protein
VRTDLNNTALRKSTYWRVATATEPTTITWRFSSPTTRATASIHSYSGVDPTNPIAAHAGQANAFSTSIPAPSVTPPIPGTVLLGLYSTASTTTIAPPEGMAERTEITSPPDATYFTTASTADQAQPTATATGIRSATASNAAVNIGQLIALRPASAA